MASEGLSATCELITFHMLPVMSTRVAPISVTPCRPETHEGVAKISSDSRKRQKVRRDGKMVDSGLRKNVQEMEDDMKRTLQLQSFDAADKGSRSPTDLSRLETPGDRSDQRKSMPSVEPGRRKRGLSGEAVLERPFKSRKPQGVLPSAERDEDRGREKAVFGVHDYVQTMEDHREKIAPIQVFCDDDGRVVGTWRGNLQTDLPGYRFKFFYGVDRVPSIGSLDLLMRRSHPERFSGAEQCVPSQAGEQSSRMSIMYSMTAPKTVASEDKAEMEGPSTSGNTAMGRLMVAERHQSIAGAQ